METQDHQRGSTMDKLTRRQLIRRASAGAALLGLGQSAFAQGLPTLGIGGPDKFDLVIRGGDVMDPSQKLRGKRDIGIRNGKIAAIETAIPAEKASQTLD